MLNIHYSMSPRCLHVVLTLVSFAAVFGMSRNDAPPLWGERHYVTSPKTAAKETMMTRTPKIMEIEPSGGYEMVIANETHSAELAITI